MVNGCYLFVVWNCCTFSIPTTVWARGYVNSPGTEIRWTTTAKFHNSTTRGRQSQPPGTEIRTAKSHNHTYKGQYQPPWGFNRDPRQLAPWLYYNYKTGRMSVAYHCDGIQRGRLGHGNSFFRFLKHLSH